MGVGAYTVAVLQTRLGTPFLLNLLAGGRGRDGRAASSSGCPRCASRASISRSRPSRPSFIAHFLFAHWTSRHRRHARALTMPPATVLRRRARHDSFRLYWVIVPVTALMVLGAANLFRTRVGRAFIAIRDRDISAEVLGIRAAALQAAVASRMSSFYAGVAGGLWAYFFRVVTPESFPLVDVDLLPRRRSSSAAWARSLGGILGAVFMTLVPELLKLVVGLAAAGRARMRRAILVAGAHHRVRPADRRLPGLRAARPGRNLAARPPLLPPLAVQDLTRITKED